MDSGVDKERFATLRAAAIGLLARREYGRQELVQRLCGQADGALLTSLLDALAEEGLQSDQRYAEALFRSRLSRGQGPVRIRQELQQKGIAPELVEEVLQELEPNWMALAQEVWERRFGRPPADRKDYAKQMRFLLYRGFSQSLVRDLLNAVGRDSDQY